MPNGRVLRKSAAFPKTGFGQEDTPVGRLLPHLPRTRLSHTEPLRSPKGPSRFRPLCKAGDRWPAPSRRLLSLPRSRTLFGTAALRSSQRPCWKLGPAVLWISHRELVLRGRRRILNVCRRICASPQLSGGSFRNRVIPVKFRAFECAAGGLGRRWRGVLSDG